MISFTKKKNKHNPKRGRENKYEDGVANRSKVKNKIPIYFNFTQPLFCPIPPHQCYHPSSFHYCMEQLAMKLAPVRYSST